MGNFLVILLRLLDKIEDETLNNAGIVFSKGFVKD